MNLHEYQAKELLKKFDLPLLKGRTYINNLDTIEKDLNDLSGPPWVVKSQIHAGGRGAGHFKKSFNDKGGVQVIQNETQVPVIAKSMLGNILITKQTGVDGKKVNRLFIEEGCKIEREFYLGLLIDRTNSQLMLMISAAGGMNIEDVAEKNPEKIYTTHFPNLTEINLPKKLEKQLELNSSQFEELLSISRKLVRAFKSLDASTIEINPLVINGQGNFVLLDAKLILDDNALFRHPELEKLKDITEENPLEYEASQNNMSYVKLDGSIGCMVNGAGLAMATMDIIKQFGEEPANFLDLG
ncbi:MAG TPA: succinate--CoA ligase subunit beta, partial [Candidatus Dadabacteria bacterium]|nr:succinate--CoA ligase subunit beta [Candidatus Dadabacteria bacterium]